MSTEPVPVVDLEAAASGMKGAHKPLAHLIFRHRDLHSAHSDLATAFDMLNSLEPASSAADDGTWINSALQALTYTAILLYARATKTTSNHRRTFKIRDSLGAADRQVHDELIALRDDAIAHFGPGHSDTGPKWNEERVLLPLDRKNDAKIVVASKRMTTNPDFLRRVTPLVQKALFMFQRRLEENESLILDAFDKAFETDPNFTEFLTHYKTNSVDVFGGHAVAAQFNGDREGMTRGYVWD